MIKRQAPLTATMAAAFLACASSAAPRPADPASGAVDRPPATEDEPPAPTPVEARFIGGCGVAPQGLGAKYILPFPPGERYTLTQGNCGTASHGGRFSYSFDFEMPIGTPVIATRGGVVYQARDDRPDGSGRVGDENFVIIEHTDGEFSRYIHLTTNGALVRKGQTVSRGDTIARSGHSGRSAFPHLHFDVARSCRGGPCRTVPSAFSNAEPPIPDDRRAYPAGPDPSR